MAKYLGVHPRDWKHSQYKLLCGEILHSRMGKQMVISLPYERSIGGDQRSRSSVRGPYSRWSLVLDPATGLRGTLPWVTRDVLIYQGLHVVSAKYVDALPNDVVSC